MHDRSQIQSKRNGRNASTRRNNKEKSLYSCGLCNFVTTNLGNSKLHKISCIEGKVENIDFIECKICGRVGISLGTHIKKHHGMSAEEYTIKFGPCITPSTVANYSRATSERPNWIIKAKEQGVDLTEYKTKMGRAVSAAIMADPKERERRREQRGKNNKTLAARKIASQTAKKTSARKDVQENRSAQLKRWRDNNPEAFQECIRQLTGKWQSKPEKALFELCKVFSDFNFKRNVFLKSTKFVQKTKRKQIDIADRQKHIYIEFDGRLHFKDAYRPLVETRQKDVLLDEHILKRGWTLIRVGYDQYSYSLGFSDECIINIKRILDSEQRGVFYLGKAYDQYPKCTTDRDA